MFSSNAAYTEALSFSQWFQLTKEVLAKTKNLFLVRHKLTMI